MLSDLTDLAAELEADAAASLYRFGASRAYYGSSMNGWMRSRRSRFPASTPGEASFSAVWRQRCAPAVRSRNARRSLSRKLTRATTLLRTWVDVEAQEQNRDVLASMNNRARLQLRLQQTVEGLSVAAVSYYVVGLIGYLAKGTSLFGVEGKA